MQIEASGELFSIGIPAADKPESMIQTICSIDESFQRFVNDPSGRTNSLGSVTSPHMDSLKHLTIYCHLNRKNKCETISAHFG
jgi:hypothetical protein